MVKKGATILGLAALIVWSASAQDAKSVIAGASKAIGVDTLKTVQYSATGYDFALGQAPNPNAPWPKFIEKSYTRTIDFEKPASRVDRVRLQDAFFGLFTGETEDRRGWLEPISAPAALRVDSEALLPVPA